MIPTVEHAADRRRVGGGQIAGAAVVGRPALHNRDIGPSAALGNLLHDLARRRRIAQVGREAGRLDARLLQRLDPSGELVRTARHQPYAESLGAELLSDRLRNARTVTRDDDDFRHARGLANRNHVGKPDGDRRPSDTPGRWWRPVRDGFHGHQRTAIQTASQAASSRRVGPGRLGSRALFTEPSALRRRLHQGRRTSRGTANVARLQIPASVKCRRAERRRRHAQGAMDEREGCVRYFCFRRVRRSRTTRLPRPDHGPRRSDAGRSGLPGAGARGQSNRDRARSDGDQTWNDAGGEGDGRKDGSAAHRAGPAAA